MRSQLMTKRQASRVAVFGLVALTCSALCFDRAASKGPVAQPLNGGGLVSDGTPFEEPELNPNLPTFSKSQGPKQVRQGGIDDQFTAPGFASGPADNTSREWMDRWLSLAFWFSRVGSF